MGILPYSGLLLTFSIHVVRLADDIEHHYQWSKLIDNTLSRVCPMHLLSCIACIQRLSPKTSLTESTMLEPHVQTLIGSLVMHLLVVQNVPFASIKGFVKPQYMTWSSNGLLCGLFRHVRNRACLNAALFSVYFTMAGRRCHQEVGVYAVAHCRWHGRT